MEEEIKPNKEQEYLNNWKRAAADLANYKKGEIERASLLVTYAKEDILLSILPIIDSVYLAAEAFGKEGFMQIEKQIEAFLKQQGIEEITAEGKPFNAETMEVVEEVSGGPTPAESGMVVKELQKGYMMNGRVLRPARVKVGK